MGFDVGAPLAAGQGAIEQMVSDMRADLQRSNLIAVCKLAASQFPGSVVFVMAGARDRDSRQLRQVAIYLAHTALQIDEAACGRVFGMHKSNATRAVQAVEERRANDHEFGIRIERLEAVIRRWTMAARSIGPSLSQEWPPTQGPIDRPVAAFAAPAGDIRPFASREVAA